MSDVEKPVYVELNDTFALYITNFENEKNRLDREQIVRNYANLLSEEDTQEYLGFNDRIGHASQLVKWAKESFSPIVAYTAERGLEDFYAMESDLSGEDKCAYVIGPWFSELKETANNCHVRSDAEHFISVKFGL